MSYNKEIISNFQLSNSFILVSQWSKHTSNYFNDVIDLYLKKKFPFKFLNSNKYNNKLLVNKSGLYF